MKESCELAVHFNSSQDSLEQSCFTIIEQFKTSVSIEAVLTNREACDCNHLYFAQSGLSRRRIGLGGIS